jgi:hypothetical protein
VSNRVSITLPTYDSHPNRRPFIGAIPCVGVPSAKSPGGARSHPVVLELQAAIRALPGLLGMGINFRPSWDGHDERRKFGIITYARIFGKLLIMRGFVYESDFSSEVVTLQANAETMGMSFEAKDSHVTDMRQDAWLINRFHFSGAAVLRADKAAYRGSRFFLGRKDKP